MAAVTVYTCPGSQQAVTSDGVPACMAGAGQWQAVTLAEPFDPSQLNGAELSGAFGAGFTVLGTGLVIAWAARALVDAIRD